MLYSRHENDRHRNQVFQLFGESRLSKSMRGLERLPLRHVSTVSLEVFESPHWAVWLRSRANRGCRSMLLYEAALEVTNEYRLSVSDLTIKGPRMNFDLDCLRSFRVVATATHHELFARAAESVGPIANRRAAIRLPSSNPDRQRSFAAPQGTRDRRRPMRKLVQYARREPVAQRTSLCLDVRLCGSRALSASASARFFGRYFTAGWRASRTAPMGGLEVEANHRENLQKRSAQRRNSVSHSSTGRRGPSSCRCIARATGVGQRPRTIRLDAGNRCRDPVSEGCGPIAVFRSLR